MINSVSFSCYRTGKTVTVPISLKYAQIWQRGILQLRDPADLSTNWIQLSSNQVTIYLPKRSQELVLKCVLVLHSYIIDKSYQKDLSKGFK